MGRKRVVHYRGNPLNIIYVGQPAQVIPIDHYNPAVSNKQFVRTSAVVKVHENGDFTTLNTRYVLKEDL